MIAQHTPGPWIIRDVGHDPDDPHGSERAYIGTVPVLANCGQHVARICGWGGDFSRDKEQQANARLLAAAPDLLAALRTRVTLVEEMTGIRQTEARAALAESGPSGEAYGRPQEPAK